jgi:hypothetical protein
VLVVAAISCQTRRQYEPDHGHDPVVLTVRPPVTGALARLGCAPVTAVLTDMCLTSPEVEDAAWLLREAWRTAAPSTQD